MDLIGCYWSLVAMEKHKLKLIFDRISVKIISTKRTEKTTYYSLANFFSNVKQFIDSDCVISYCDI